MTVIDIYEKLGLEDPFLFALTRIGQQEHLELSSASGHQELTRRTGRTTYTCACAIADALNRKDVLIRTANVPMATHIIHTIAQMIDKLGYSEQVERYCLYPHRLLDLKTGGRILVSLTNVEEHAIQVDKVYEDELKYRPLNEGESLEPKTLFLRR